MDFLFSNLFFLQLSPGIDFLLISSWDTKGEVSMPPPISAFGFVCKSFNLSFPLFVHFSPSQFPFVFSPLFQLINQGHPHLSIHSLPSFLPPQLLLLAQMFPAPNGLGVNNHPPLFLLLVKPLQHKTPFIPSSIAYADDDEGMSVLKAVLSSWPAKIGSRPTPKSSKLPPVQSSSLPQIPLGINIRAQIPGFNWLFLNFLLQIRLHRASSFPNKFPLQMNGAIGGGFTVLFDLHLPLHPLLPLLPIPSIFFICQIKSKIN
jgi:hypothetical protein